MSRRVLGFGALAILALLAVAWLALGRRPEPVAVSEAFTLRSDRITLPEETAALPAGNDLITVNCTACHSPEMLTAQPVLDAKKWQATIDKMRTVYKAQIAPADDKALIAALMALPTQRGARPYRVGIGAAPE